MTLDREEPGTDLAVIRAAVELGLLTPQRAAEAMLLRKAKGESTAFPQFLEDWGFLESDGRRTLIEATQTRASPADPRDPDATTPYVSRTPLADPKATMADTGRTELDRDEGQAASGASGITSPRMMLGPFEIVGELGRGGMGKVYLATDPRLDRTVALKVMGADLAANPEAKKRFLREAQTAAKLDHPHIVKVYEVGEAPNPHGPGQPYIAMEYVEGVDFAALLHGKVRLEAGGRRLEVGESRDPASRLPLREALEIVRQVTEALAYAHAKGLVHRDVKPSNILVTTSSLQPPVSSLPTAKLTDFGLARGARDEGHTRLTKTGVVMGTPHYMSPEQWDAVPEKIQAPADQYSLGCMLYEVLTGDPPFKDTTVMAVLAGKAAGEDPPAPRLKNPKVHPDLETIALKALEKEPSRRYASCKELAKDLGRFLAGEPIAARPVGRVERATKWVRRNRLAAAGLGAAGLAVLVLLALLASKLVDGWRRSTEHDRRIALAVGCLERGGFADAALHYQEALRQDSESDTARRGVELARKKEQAANWVLEGHEHLAKYEQLLAGLPDLEARLAEAEDGTPAWAELSEKLALFDRRGKARTAREGLEGSESLVIGAFTGALGADPDNPDAPRLLADFYWRRFEAEERVGRPERVAFYKRLCLDLDKRHDLGYATRFRAEGLVSFDTTPSGADLYLFRYESETIGPEDGKVTTVRLLPVPANLATLGVETRRTPPPASGDAGSRAYPLPWSQANWVGRTPLPGLELPPGSYLFLIRSLGKRDTRYPVFIHRGADWRSERAAETNTAAKAAGTDTAAAKAAVPIPIPLYTNQEIGEDFVYVPPGPFRMGEPEELGTFGAVEPKDVWVDGFFMGRFEVSIEEYADFLADQAFHTRDDPKADERLAWPALTLGKQPRRLPRQAPNSGAYFGIGSDGRPQVPDGWRGWPVLGISWEDAAAYVRWKNTRSRLDQDSAGNPADPATWPYRLAADDEWEKAARGVDGRAYPWGPEFDASLCLSGLSWSEAKDKNPRPRGEKPGDESVYGMHDLAGSMREWCDDWQTVNEFRLVRGGAWSTAAPTGFRCAYRNGVGPVYVNADVGFRVVRAAREPR